MDTQESAELMLLDIYVQENGCDSEKITKSSKVDLSNCHPVADLSSHSHTLLYCSVEESQRGFCR